MSSMTYKKVNVLGDYINGRFVVPESVDGQIKNISPSDLNDHICTITYQLSHIDRAVEAAQKAYLPWAALPVDERKKYLMRVKEIFIQHEAEIAEAIARDTGKPLWDSTTEAKALVGKIDITLNESMKLVQEERITNALPQVDGVIRHRSRGVMAVIGPFNFPAHLPNGHIIPALATGNTVVYKPSEQTPYVGQLYAQLIDKAELPAGVFNLVQGEGETGRRLVAHEKIDGPLIAEFTFAETAFVELIKLERWKLLF